LLVLPAIRMCKMLGRRSGPLGRAGDEAVDDNTRLDQPMGHRGGIPFTPVIERTVDIANVGTVPAAFGVPDDQKGLHDLYWPSASRPPVRQISKAWLLMKFISETVFLSFSFFRMLCRCTSTVLSEIFKSDAISLEDKPSFSARTICISRSERLLISGFT